MIHGEPGYAWESIEKFAVSFSRFQRSDLSLEGYFQMEMSEQMI